MAFTIYTRTQMTITEYTTQKTQFTTRLFFVTSFLRHRRADASESRPPTQTPTPVHGSQALPGGTAGSGPQRGGHARQAPHQALRHDAHEHRESRSFD